MFYEFDRNVSDINFSFYPIFLCRRAGYILALYYLPDFPLIQITVGIYFVISNICLLRISARFEDKWNHRLTLAVELVLGLLYFLILIYNSKVSETTSVVMKFANLTATGMMACMAFINFFVRLVTDVQDKCKKTKIVPEQEGQQVMQNNWMESSSRICVPPLKIDIAIENSRLD